MSTTTTNRPFGTVAAAQSSNGTRVIGLWLPVLAVLTVVLAAVAGDLGTVRGGLGVAGLGVFTMAIVAGLRATHDRATGDHLL